MSVTLSDLRSTISARLENAQRQTVIKKGDVLDQIENVRLSLSNVLLFTNSTMTMDVRRGWMNEIKLLAADKKPYAKTYMSLIERLTNNAAKIEQNIPFSILPDTARSLMGSLNDAYKLVDKEFPDKLNVYTAKFSQLAVMGVVDTCSTFSSFCLYLMSGVIIEMVKEDIPLPPYRIKFIEDNLQIAIKIVNDAAANTGPMALDYIIKELQRSNNDIPVVDNNNNPNTAFLNISKLSNVSQDMMKRGLFNPFFTMGRLYVQWKDAKMKRVEQEKEWIESNLALLKLKLDDYDPDAPEYQKLIKIIKRYSEQLSKIDRQLREYYKQTNKGG